MTTTTVKAIYTPRNIQVEVRDVIEMGGVKLASIKALSGKPFADGAKTTTRTAYCMVRVDELEVCTCTPRDEIACHACRRATNDRYGDELPY